MIAPSVPRDMPIDQRSIFDRSRCSPAGGDNRSIGAGNFIGRASKRTATVLVARAVVAPLVVVLTLIVGSTGCGTTEPAVRSTDDERTPVLSATGADYFSGTRTDGPGSYTSVPITFRNDSTSPVTLRSISVGSTTNLRIERTLVIGPQRPSRTFNLYKGSPATARPDDALEPLDPETVEGFTIRPDGRGPAPSLPPYRTKDGHDLVSDQTNDASPVFVVRAIDPTRDASATGITVTYDVDGQTITQRFPDVAFHLCAPTGEPTPTCTRS